jgi:hypothetical protein
VKNGSEIKQTQIQAAVLGKSLEREIHLSGSRRKAYRVFLVISALVVLLATSLRIYRIAQRSLWLDEAIAANISRGTLAQTLTLTRGLHSAPITDPLILYAVERLGSGPLAVRMPSLVASVLAVFLMLCFVTIPSIDYKTAGLAALMLSVSATQIRYAQEVREYSLSVLYAAVLLYVFLSYVSKKEEHNSPTPLYLALFFAPLVQYGLVLFSCGILSALLILDFTSNKHGRRLAQIVAASGFLALGGLLSFFLTLRYQWGDDAWYLKDYLWAPGSSFLHFVLSNTHHLITFLLPGLAAALISTLAILIHLGTSIRARIVPPIAVLAFTSCGIVLMCSILRLYPYGGIRQCLFLAPVLCLLASEGLVQVANRIPGRAHALAFVAIVCVVAASGVFQIRLLKPYAEVEDIQKVLLSLRSNIEPGDEVYIYPGAVFAVDFYVKKRDSRFMYGDYHQQAPEKYASEIRSGLEPEVNRLWIVFSHIYRDEDQRILHDLGKDWNVEPVLSVQRAALYRATRRAVAMAAVPTKDSKTTFVADHTHDSFWEWNIRNSRQQSQCITIDSILKRL